MSRSYQAFELAFEERAGYLYASITSSAISLERSQEYLTQIVEHCRGHEICRVLIDRHIPQALTNIDAYKAVTALAETVTFDLRVAFVETNPKNRKRLEFGMRAARSQGLDADVFGSVADAEKWLLRN